MVRWDHLIGAAVAHLATSVPRRPGSAELAVYDLTGRRVKTLVSGSVAAGEHEVQWDGSVDKVPARAGIDPHYLLIDKEADNNMVDVVMR